MSGTALEIAKERAAAKGLGAIENPVKFRGQDYEKLKSECLASGTLFEDSEFPAAPSSLGVNKMGPNSKEVKGIEWKRPKEICDNPHFMIQASRDDIRQGQLGDCWFLASLASLTMNEECLKKVIPEGQTFKSDYAGIFHFVIWRYGEWVDVVVDDQLPTKNGKLRFLKSDTNEFWSALIEKAYAKLCGCYEALISGSATESMTDFTAGSSERFLFKYSEKDLLPIIQKAFEENSFLSCAGDSRKEFSEVVRLHAYSVTGLEEVDYGDGKVQLIRVRNPWGFAEGKGAWSDGSPEWDKVDPKVKAKLHEKQDDGEFWMSYSDFLKEFDKVDICYLNLSKAYCGGNYQWYLKQFNGSWTAGCSAGGNMKSETFWTNPKFKIKLQDTDEENEGAKKECSVFISLMQKGQRRKKPKGANFYSIGCYIFKITGDEEVGKEFFKKNNAFTFHATFYNIREVASHFKLPPGDYVIVPCTVRAGEEAEFCLRIYTRKPIQAVEIGNTVEANPFEPGVKNDKDYEQEFKDLDENGEYNEDEVKKFLDSWISTKYQSIKFTGFSMESVQKMIKLVDLDKTKTLSTPELKALWIKLQHFINIFFSNDADKSGTIDAHEFRNTLKQAGFAVNDKVLELIVQRYINKENLTLSFNDFISCMIRLETMFKMFKILENDEGGVMSLDLSEWIRLGMS